jgi:replication-associated recombination protein RarA
MGLFTAQAGLAFPASLSEKYRPHDLADFVGLEKPKKVLAKFAANPFPNAAFLFVGPSGTGKTSMALALCEAIGGELHHIPSQSCNVDLAVFFSRYGERGRIIARKDMDCGDGHGGECA